MRRFLGPASLALLMGALALPPALSAQSDLGKLQGRITDSDGQPIGQAQVLITGTAFGAVTDPQGFYFINNIPAGTMDARIRMIGFGPIEVQGIHIVAGQTVTQDAVLTPQPVELEEITVVSAYNVLVPRDEVTTKQRVDGEFTEQLPVDQLSQALGLQPGVIRDGTRLSVRGGRADENVVYVDGVPVNSAGRQDAPGWNQGKRTPIEVPLGGVEQASVTTGAYSSEYGGGQSGLISVQTRAGGRHYAGMLGYESDEMFGSSHSLGLNRITGAFGGPIAGGLTFHLSGTLTGQQSVEQGQGSENYPIFVAAGVDTTVVVPSTLGTLVPADTTFVDVLKLAVSRGNCGDFAKSSNPDIRNNYGFDCRGIRVPYNPRSLYQLQGKLSQSYGSGSYLSLTLLAQQDQTQVQDYWDIYNTDLIRGSRSLDRVATLGWSQNLSRRADRALALQVYLSYQTSNLTAGPLSVTGGMASRESFGGFLIAPLDFRFGDFKVNQQIVENFQRQDGVRSPLDLESPGQFRGVDQWRNNAYGILGFTERGGPGGVFQVLSSERRGIGRSTLDWQVDRYNRVRAGAEYTRIEMSEYQHGVDFSNDADVWISNPVKGAVYAEDRIDLGDLVFVGGLRYDWYNSDGHRPMWFDSTSGKRRYFPRIHTNPDYADSLGVNRLFQPYQTHTYLSPRVQVAFPVTDRLNMRFSYAHQVAPPDFNLILRRQNSDASICGCVFGADVDFAKTITFEFGTRYAFSQDMVLDVSIFNRDDLSRPAVRTHVLFDPVRRTNPEVSVMTSEDFGNVRGIDVRLDRRIGTWFNGFLGYTFQDAKNTGSDPLSYFDRASLLLGSLSGQTFAPPQAALPTRDSRPHNFTGALAFTVPPAWNRGSFAGTVLSNFGAFATFRFASGTAYTACPATPSNTWVLSTTGGCAYNQALEAINGARLPSLKEFDLRLTKGFRLGPTDLTAYFEARNLFNFTNTVQVFSSTGTIKYNADRALWWAADSVDWARNSETMGVVAPGGGMDLTFGGNGMSGCAIWVNNAALPAAPDCVYLTRAEQRWGNGDGIFDLSEQRRASGAYYDVVRGGTHLFTASPRRMRLGIELNF